MSSPLSDDVGAMAFVQAAQLCAGLPEECLSQLFEAGVIEEHQPESVVVLEGDDDQGMFMILASSVAMQKAGATGDIELAILERPAILMAGREQDTEAKLEVDS